jgi:YidC/Oxa1 family membrane protein insertase
MDRTFRWILIAAVAIIGWIYLPRLFGGSSSSEPQPIGIGQTETSIHKLAEAPPAKCTIAGPGFRADLSSRGAALVDCWVTGNPRYADQGQPMDLATVPGSAPERFVLSFDWRALGTHADDAQIAHDVVDWTIDAHDDASCTFVYSDDRVRLTKTVRAGKAPYEILTSATIENASTQKRVHRLGIENTAWRREKEIESHLGRQAPFQTEVVCGKEGGKTVRKSPSDFSAKDFQKPEFKKGWYIEPGPADFAATTNAYFAQALVPLGGPARPECGMQIEERWFREQYPDKSKDPNFGAMYRSRLIYPEKELGPGEKATYEVLTYMGPKDRTVLAHAASGQHHLSELINLGFFAPISRVLVGFLVKVHEFVRNWGIAIIVLTVVVRIALFPLTWKQIKSIVGMRRLKPDLDEINKKFKDDPQQKQLAMMEVYRKNGVNPLGGCLPILIQMPVWWALYTVLQTAVELYRTPFLWFPDLSAPDPVFVLPIVIGATSFVQQKMMPQQADLAQQKMMLYFMPALFTVMMLFLPAGLGVYILTNSVLGIVQQQVVEKFAPKASPPPAADSGGAAVRPKSARPRRS